MSLRIEVLFLILGCMLVTIIPRVLPLIFAEKVSLSKKTRIWLKQVPPVVISAKEIYKLYFKEILLPMEWLPHFSDAQQFLLNNTLLIAGITTRNLLITVDKSQEF